MVLSGLYNAVFRRTSTFALAIVVGAVFFERAFDVCTDSYFRNINRGVRVVFQTLLCLTVNHQ